MSEALLTSEGREEIPKGASGLWTVSRTDINLANSANESLHIITHEHHTHIHTELCLAIRIFAHYRVCCCNLAPLINRYFRYYQNNLVSLTCLRIFVILKVLAFVQFLKAHLELQVTFNRTNFLVCYFIAGSYSSQFLYKHKT